MITERPVFSPSEAEALTLNLYGITAVAHPLPGERDQNFRMSTKSGEQYVLKIANAAESADILEMQNQAMAHVRRTIQIAEVLPCAKVITAVSGNLIETLVKNDTEYLIRLISYLPGTLFAHIQPHDAHLQRDVGRFLGKIDQALASFSHPAARRTLKWDLAQANFITDYTQNILDDDSRQLVEFYLKQFQTFTLPRLSQQRQQIIHGDANDYNLLVHQNKNTADFSIIDFGDMVYAPLICDLAIAAAYAILHQPDPILAAAQIIGGYHETLPLLEEEISLLPNLIAMRLCVSVTMSATNQIAEPENEYLQISAQPAWEALHKLALVEPEFAEMVFRHACRLPVFSEQFAVNRVQSRKEELISTDVLWQKRRALLGPNLSLSYERPLQIVRGYRQYLYDENGRAFLDAVNNVPHVGHCHPRVVEAGQRQMARLNTNTRYLHPQAIQYAERLAAKFPDPLSVIYFVCSGSEANELALRLARTYTNRHDVLVLDAAYHGNTGELVNISPYKFNGRGGQGAPDYVHVLPMPDPYRGPFKGYGRETGRQYAQAVPQTIAEMGTNGRQPAAFIAESLLGCGGQIVLPDGYLAEAYVHVRAAGGVCIADEVQIGFGRVGSHFWGFETQGVVPDIVTLGKPMGNGHPLAAVITTPEIAAAFNNGMEYFNTFGGNAVSCAIGTAVLDVIEQENLQANAWEVGNHLLAELRRLQEKHAIIGDVRGLGLYIGVELVRDRRTLEPADREAEAIVNAMKDRGILLSTDGPWHNVLKIKPPLIFTQENAEHLVQTLNQVLKAQETSRNGRQHPL